MTKPRFILTLEADGTGDPPVAVRLRGLLKSALRAHRLRCVAISPERLAGERSSDAATAEALSDARPVAGLLGQSLILDQDIP